ncbi:DUF2306 domain-containing protein [Pannonibacter tanglangensis]|uniref:DUF2306 domain-containing protein n=1 Tax=Pannonibacter tanglangensis TaxID=2750084 RepID=A0ABW9ZPN5_9HYPH|nr:DUF2306 domain-containing protein [Pannonibacter sp. XCT-34]NBN65857.1 DUF2306 domain-containing protein [Pannonibacter sp. XCT-34]
MPVSLRSSRLGLALLTLSCLAVALASWRTAVAPFELAMAHMVHYLDGYRLPMYAHIIFGPVALALVPLQVWPGSRRRPALHRWSGQLYVLSILLAALGSLAMLPAYQGSTFTAAGFLTLALLWIATTGMGLVRALQGRFDDHRIWMLRSAALTVAAVTLRLIMFPLMASGQSVLETYEITAWGSWLINLVAVEAWLAWRGRWRLA